MSDLKSMSVKAFLSSYDGNSTEEVRRFGVPEGVSTNFEYLQQRVKSVFGLSPSNAINIFWEDSDEDRIIISSDDELLEAIAECICRQKQQLLKLYISPKKEDSRNDPKSTEDPKLVIHFGVTCDGCEGSIVGERFKCISCFDYDLCASCKSKGIHRHHPMKNLGHPKTKHGRAPRVFKCPMFDEKMENESDEKCMGPGGCQGNSGKRSGGGRNRWGGGRGRRSWGGMGDGNGRCPHSGYVPPTVPSHPVIDLSECFEQFFPEEVRGRFEEANSQAAGHVADFMKNIWESWSGAFEQSQQGKQAAGSSSSGTKPKTSPTSPPKENIINIEIEVDEAEQSKTVKTDKTAKKDNSSIILEKSTQVIPPQQIVSENAPQAVAANAPQSVASNAPQVPQQMVSEEVMEVDYSSSSPTNVVEDWTLVNKENSSGPSSPIEIDNISIDDDIQVITPQEARLSSNSVYPKLPAETSSIVNPVSDSTNNVTTEASASAVVIEETLTTEEQRIKDSLRCMSIMGYTDEGGWLTRLLQLKKGDINQVLDILMAPHKK